MRLFLLLVCLSAGVMGFAQGTETFTNISTTTGAGASAGYFTRIFTGNNGLQWTATQTRIDQVINGAAPVFRNGSVSTPAIPNGIGSLTFNYKYFFTGNAGILTIKVNGNVVGTVDVPNTATTTQTATINNINVPGTFSLEIVETSPVVAIEPSGFNPNARKGIDDVSWTAFAGSACVAPTAQPTNLVWGTIANTTINGSFTASAPASDEYLVIMSSDMNLNTSPVNGTVYTADDLLGNGVVIKRSNSLSFVAEGLNPGTTYHFFVFSVSSGCNGGPLYLAASPLLGMAATTSPPACVKPLNVAGALTFNPSNTSIGGSIAASADADGYLVVYNTTGTITFTPTDGTSYVVNQEVGSGNTGKVVSFGPGNTFNATGLIASTTYYFYVFPVSGFTCTGGPLYNNTSTNGNATTTATANTGEPAGYYSNASGKSCDVLKTALKSITINGMTPRSYGDLWGQYIVTDIKPREVGSGSSNVIWDVYSDKPSATDPYNFTPVTNQCGSYSGEGQCYNREHSFPQSWFTTGTSVGPGTDYHHIFPTDGKVNAVRSSYIYGEVAVATITSLNGSKLGSSAIAGFSGPVFEPIDEYKGDLARAFLYMVTRYEDDMPTWGAQSSNATQAIDANKYPSVDVPYLRLMLKWHTQDPVSSKEITRNNGAYSFQKNRNPYVDHPEYANMVWNSNCTGLSALPVQIVFFGGKLTGGHVTLNWVAENEINFKYFEIERSVNGTSFTAIGQVTSANLHNYSYKDDVDALRGRRVYYRLKKVDRDGKFSYTETFTLHIPNNTRFSVYPNPSTGAIQLQLSNTVAGKVSIQVTDALGRIVQQQTFNVNGSNIKLNTSALGNGTYLVKLIYNGEQFIQKILIAK